MSKIKTKIKVLSEKNNKDGLEISYADIYSFDFLPDNIKAHDEAGIEESIIKFGFVEPILVNKNTNYDISGNGRLTVLRSMFEKGAECPKGIIEKITPFEQVANEIPVKMRKWFAPVVLLDISAEEESTLAIKLNRTNEKGGLDYQKAFKVLMELKSKSESAFEATGFDAKSLEHIQMLAKFRNQLDEHNQSKTDETVSDETENSAPKENVCIELNRKWKVETGDLWQIGNHRLICADSKLPETYEKLLNGAKVRLVFTSPPYDNARSYELTEKLDWTDLMNNVTKSIFERLDAPADVIINLGIVSEDAQVKLYWNDWLAFCKQELKNPLYGWYVWDKLGGTAGEYHGRLAPAFEFLFHFSFGRQSANKWIEKINPAKISLKRTIRQKDGNTKLSVTKPESGLNEYKLPDSVIRITTGNSQTIRNEGHPATFPVALPSFIIKTWSMIGDIILEPFCGSGTTMEAAQHLDRFCYAVELSPNYCALILETMHLAFPELEIKKI